jgi:uncharacterized tellurite resistance protein B-like protein
MLKKIKELFIKKEPNPSSDDKDLNQNDINKVCAALLIEVAFADNNFSEDEKSVLTKDLQVTYSLSEEEINGILQNAEKAIKESTSLYAYTRSVNDTFEYSKKIELIKAMWKIAFSDGNLDKYEEHLIRKVSDLIHLSHSDFINTKLEAKI